MNGVIKFELEFAIEGFEFAGGEGFGVVIVIFVGLELFLVFDGDEVFEGGGCTDVGHY